jgi:hypothetical protein
MIVGVCGTVLPVPVGELPGVRVSQAGPGSGSAQNSRPARRPVPLTPYPVTEPGLWGPRQAPSMPRRASPIQAGAASAGEITIVIMLRLAHRAKGTGPRIPAKPTSEGSARGQRPPRASTP